MGQVELLWGQIRLLRKSKGVTQQQLADAVQCTRQEISKMENGHFRGSVKKVQRVSDFLGCQLAMQKMGIECISETAVLQQPVQILAIDDDPAILRGYQQLFSREQANGMHSLLSLLKQPASEEVQPRYQLTTAVSGEEGYELVKQSLDDRGNSSYDLLLLDMRLLGEWDGLRTAHELRKIVTNIKIIIVSAYQDYSLSKMRETIGEDFIFQSKPYNQEQLVQLAEYVVTH